MIPLSKHAAAILDPDTRSPLPVDPVSVEIGMDDEWSPRIQGRIIVHASDADILDRARVIVRLRQSFGPDLSIAALTEWVGGSVAAVTTKVGGSVAAITAAHTSPWNLYEVIRPLSAFTARWGGNVAAVTSDVQGNVERITAAMRQEGGSYQPPPAQTLEALLRVRPAETDYAPMLVEFELDSEDIALHDYRRPVATTYESPATDLRTLVAAMLTNVRGVLAPGGTAAIPARMTWSPGQTIWDALHPVLEAVGWQLYAGPDGLYYLEPGVVTPVPVALTGDSNMLEFRSETAPEYDAAVVEYNAITPSEYDIYAPAGSQRVMHVTRYTVKPGSGAARELVARALARGKSVRTECTSLYNVRPGQRVQLRPRDETMLGTVSAVRWKYPESRMSITARDIT